jgi:hypothetical protein
LQLDQALPSLDSGTLLLVLRNHSVVVVVIQRANTLERFVNVLRPSEGLTTIVLLVDASQNIVVNFENLNGFKHGLLDRLLILLLLHAINHLLLLLLPIVVVVQLLGAIVVRERNDAARHLLVHRRALLGILRRLVARLERSDMVLQAE